MAASQDKKIEFLKARMRASDQRQRRHVHGFNKTVLRVMAKLEDSENQCDCTGDVCHCEPPLAMPRESRPKRTMRIKQSDQSWFDLKAETADARKAESNCREKMMAKAAKHRAGKINGARSH